MIPRPYQEVGRDFLAARRHALLADQMRVGKTPQAILAADKVSAQNVLVLCPAIATYQWRAEWAAWSPERPPAFILGREAPIHFRGVVIASYNRGMQHLEALCKQRWDVFIPDEAHYAKNPEAGRTKMVYGKGGLGWASDRIWALTGTPTPNHAGEVWPMLRAYGVVKMTYLEFISYFCYYDWQQQRVLGNKLSTLSELRALMASVVLRRTRKEVAPEMPEIGYSFLNLAPVAGVDLPSEDLSAIDEEDRIAVTSAMVPGLAAEIIEQISLGTYAQTVVFGYHIAPLEQLRQRLHAAGISAELLTGRTTPAQRQQIQAMFRAGAIQVVIGQIIAAGVAIDLSAASHGYLLEMDWVPGNNEQAASRMVNLQTREPVTVDVVTWPGTVLDAVQRTLLRKVQGALFRS